MAKRKADKVLWILQQRRLFSAWPIAAFDTEVEARAAETKLIEEEGARPSTLSVHRVNLLTSKEFAGVTWL